MVYVTMDPLPRSRKGDQVAEDGWQGWRRTHTDRTFIEYRYNEKAGSYYG